MKSISFFLVGLGLLGVIVLRAFAQTPDLGTIQFPTSALATALPKQHQLPRLSTSRIASHTR